MAQQTVVELIDDLTGGQAVTTVNFGLDGKAYEIDLNEANESALRAVLAEYLAAARETSLSTRPAATITLPAATKTRKVLRAKEPAIARPPAAKAPSPEVEHTPATAGQPRFSDNQAGRPLFSAAR